MPSTSRQPFDGVRDSDLRALLDVLDQRDLVRPEPTAADPDLVAREWARMLHPSSWPADDDGPAAGVAG